MKPKIVISEIELRHNIGKRLKQIRLFYGLKAKEMANILGVKHNTYSEYESGKVKPSLNILIRAATFFCESLDFIVNIEQHTNSYKYTELLLHKKSNHIPFMDKVHIRDQQIYGVTWKYIDNSAIYQELGCDLFFRMLNNDMYPKYNKDDIIFINTDHRHDFPSEGNCYLIYLDGFNYIINYHNGNFISINNPAHCFNYLENEAIQIIGRVVGNSSIDTF